MSGDIRVEKSKVCNGKKCDLFVFRLSVDNFYFCLSKTQIFQIVVIHRFDKECYHGGGSDKCAFTTRAFCW